MSDKRTRRSWNAMRDRCLNQKHVAWKNYGGRGIGICERWSIFENFVNDMGVRPEGKSLDRIDNDQGYGPSNCRWATSKEQGRNRSDNVRVSLNGRLMTVVEASETTGMSPSLLHSRLRAGWTQEQTFNEPIGKGGPAGVEQHLAKLDDISVECLRVVYATHLFSQRELAKWWGVRQATVKCVTRGTTWKHVGGPRFFGRRP